MYALLGVVVVVAVAVGVVFARKRATRGHVKRGRPQQAWGEGGDVSVSNPMQPAQPSVMLDTSYSNTMAQNGLGHGRTRSNAAAEDW